MKKIQQILAILGIVLLLGLYLTTLFLPIWGKNFMAALLASMALPVLLWVYGYIYKLIKRNSKQNSENNLS